ncbi:DUF4401 domain-containing protein [Polluticoccus soli]|uniref:DUF4401 domain-containing protein n=1 Tax=Polluticoccus soli TaxID=3034150 RepID=UPI0023E0C176|nr:DUF4401 domain-containing protein [Flavipsychrobacter sp. JY13-12]
MEQNKTIDEVLQDAAILQGGELEYNRELIDHDMAREHASIYEGLGVRILSIVGGFLACLFFIGFLFLAGVVRSEGAMGVCGALFVVATIIVGATGKNRFLDGASIAMLLTGLGLLGAGLKFTTGTTAVVYMVAAVATFVMVKNQLLSFVAVLLFWGSFAWFLSPFPDTMLMMVLLLLLAISYTLVSIAEPRFITGGKLLNNKYTALRAGLLFSFIGLLIVSRHMHIYSYLIGNRWISWCIVIICIIITLYHIAQQTGLPTKQLVLITLAVVVVMAPFLYAAAVPGSLLILLLSVHTRNRTGFAVGIMGMLYFVSRYYYDLNQTLLLKSAILFVPGLLFLAAWWFTRKFQHNEQA